MTLPSPPPSILHPSLPRISMGSKEQVARTAAYNPARGYFCSIEILIVESLQSIESNVGLSEAVTRNLTVNAEVKDSIKCGITEIKVD